MLPSFRKRLGVVLCPTHVALTLTPAGWRPRPLAPEVVPCTPVAGAPAWQAPLAALRHWLEHQRHGAAAVDVIVSDSLTHYALIPWSDEVRTRAERIALSGIHFETLFGTRAGQWRIHADAGAHRQGWIACGAEAAFIASLGETLAGGGMRLRSVQPYFMRAFNRWRGRMPDNALLVVVESGQCVMASCKDGHWHSIRSVRLGQHAEAELTRLIERETLLQGLDETAAVLLHAPGPFQTGQLAGLPRLTVLETLPAMPGRVAALGMAMGGGN